MSQDQKPKAIRGVAPVRVAQSAPGTPADAAGGAGGTSATGDAGADTPASQPAKAGLPLVPIALFLTGCLLGGGGLAALPHVAPRLASSLVPGLFGLR